MLFNSNYIEHESKGNKEIITLLIKEYLNIITPDLRDIINDHKTRGEQKVNSSNEEIDYKTQGEWKIKLTMIINLISSTDSDERRTLHTKSNNIEIMMGNKADEIIDNLFESLMQRRIKSKNQRK